MSGHWLKLQNGPARRSRVIVWIQLQYYQIRQFCTPSVCPGGAGQIQNWKKPPGGLDPSQGQGTFMPGFEEIGPATVGEIVTEKKDHKGILHAML